MLKIIVDSTVDLTKEYMDKHNIDQISLQVFIDNEPFRDIKEIQIETLFEALEENKDVKTSLPVLSDMYDLFKKYAKEKTEFVFFTFSKKMSGTFNAATLIINELKEKYDTNMTAIDTQNGGMSSAMVVKRFIENINDEMTFDEKVAYAISLTNKVKQIFLVNDLTQLKNGGRISTLQSLIGSLIHIKPILHIEGGEIKVYKNIIGLKRALNEIIRFTTSKVPNKNVQIGLSFVKNENILNDTVKLLNDAGYHNLVINRLASVMSAHIGLDAVSINFFLE